MKAFCDRTSIDRFILASFRDITRNTSEMRVECRVHFAMAGVVNAFSASVAGSFRSVWILENFGSEKNFGELKSVAVDKRVGPEKSTHLGG